MSSVVLYGNVASAVPSPLPEARKEEIAKILGLTKKQFEELVSEIADVIAPILQEIGAGLMRLEALKEESARLGAESARLGSESARLGAESARLGAESASLGMESLTLGQKSESL